MPLPVIVLSTGGAGDLNDGPKPVPTTQNLGDRINVVSQSQIGTSLLRKQFLGNPGQ